MTAPVIFGNASAGCSIHAFCIRAWLRSDFYIRCFCVGPTAKPRRRFAQLPGDRAHAPYSLQSRRILQAIFLCDGSRRASLQSRRAGLGRTRLKKQRFNRRLRIDQIHQGTGDADFRELSLPDPRRRYRTDAVFRHRPRFPEPLCSPILFQYFGHELRRVVGPSGARAVERREAGAMLAEHRRGRSFALSSRRRGRHRFPDRHREIRRSPPRRDLERGQR